MAQRKYLLAFFDGRASPSGGSTGDGTELTGNSSGYGSPQRLHRGLRDLIGAVLGRAGLARRHHVGFEQSALQVHMVVSQRLVLESQHLQNQSDTCSDTVDTTPQSIRKCNSHPFRSRNNISVGLECQMGLKFLTTVTAVIGKRHTQILSYSLNIQQLTCSVTRFAVSRSWSPSGRTSGSTIGTRPFYNTQNPSVHHRRFTQLCC